MRRTIVLGILSSFFFNQFLWSHTLSKEIDALIKKELPHATIGILVKDAQTGQII
jgi:D-alanyl-D-alanine carboxypeptidase/D-alanyl-D-alanine-endopeptidase (penicillin-binding protein 4)